MAKLLSVELAKIEGLEPLIQDQRATLHGYHVYIFRYNETILDLSREKFINALVAEGIPAFSGYTFPLYKNPMYLNKKFINGSFPLGTKYHDDIDYADFAEKCPVSEKACSSEAVWLPQNIFLGTEKDIYDVVEAVTKVLDNKGNI